MVFLWFLCIHLVVSVQLLLVQSHQSRKVWKPVRSSVVVYECNRYGMREALSIAAGEGLEAMWARHQQVQKSYWDSTRKSCTSQKCIDSRCNIVGAACKGQRASPAHHKAVAAAFTTSHASAQLHALQLLGASRAAQCLMRT